MKNNFKIHFLNTIWSDSIILESDNHYAFVDCASNFYYPMIQEYLKSLNITKLDFILLTHFHSDHYGNVAKIINDYDVKCLYLKKYSAKEGDTGDGKKTTEEYFEHEMMMYNEIIEAANKNNVEMIFLDDIKYANDDNYIINFNNNILELYNLRNMIKEVFDDKNSPYYQKYMFSENNNSIIIYANINSHKIFLGSDLTDSDTEAKVFYRLSERFLKQIYEKHNIDYIDVYKSCHHGGGATNKIELIQLLNCKYAVITNTDHWLERWPTIEYLKSVRKNVEIFKTDHYQYVFDFSNKKIKIEKKQCESLFLSLSKG